MHNDQMTPYAAGYQSGTDDDTTERVCAGRGHNRCLVLVRWASGGISSGTVSLKVADLAPGDQGRSGRPVQIGTGSYNARGTSIFARIPPGAQLELEVHSTAGSGDWYATFWTWREGGD